MSGERMSERRMSGDKYDSMIVGLEIRTAAPSYEATTYWTSRNWSGTFYDVYHLGTVGMYIRVRELRGGKERYTK